MGEKTRNRGSLQMQTTISETVAAPRPKVRHISVEDVYAALSEGWADFRAVPRFGLFFGGVYALAGIFILLQLSVWQQHLWIFPLAFAFPLIGPFVAVGLYEVSRRRELGQPLAWNEILASVWGQRNGQMPSMAFVVLAGFMIWIWVAHMLVALMLGRMQFAVYSDIDILFSTGSGLALLFFGTIIGFIIAFCLFSITAISIPMLIDRQVDFVTAMITSVDSVRSNTRAMFAWAWIVAASLVVAMIPFFLGLVIVLPVLGHGTWHLYRKVVEPPAEAVV